MRFKDFSTSGDGGCYEYKLKTLRPTELFMLMGCSLKHSLLSSVIPNNSYSIKMSRIRFSRIDFSILESRWCFHKQPKCFDVIGWCSPNRKLSLLSGIVGKNLLQAIALFLKDISFKMIRLNEFDLRSVVRTESWFYVPNSCQRSQT